MRTLPKRWARQYLYTTGPKSGSPSKIAPDSITLQGTQPGTGARIGAEELNELLSVYGEHVENHRLQGLTQWSVFPAGATNALAVVRHPYTGEIWVTTATSEVQFTDSTCEQITSTATGFSSTTQRSACARKDTAGNASIVIFGSYASGIRARYTPAGNAVALANADVANAATPTGMRSCVYDSVGACVIGFSEGTISSQKIVRFPDAGTALIYATTVPATADVGSVYGTMLASGGGTTLLIYAINAGTFAAYKSTDAGVTWVASTAPPGGTTATETLGVYYSEDFIGLGPKFVCLTSSTSAGRKLHHSTDGSVWTTISPPAYIAALGTGSRGTLVGSSVIYAYNGSRQITVWDIARGTYTAFAPLLYGSSFFWITGGRLYSRQATGNLLYVSGRIHAPYTPTLGRMPD